MHLSLVDTLIAGLPSPLRVGMTASELVTELGPTERVLRRGRKDSRPAILKYGDLEFHFGDVGLERMFSDTFTLPQGTDQLVVAPGWIRRGLLVEDAERQIAAL